MPGRFASVKVPHYPKSWKLAGDVLVTGMWLWVLFMCKEKGPYTFVSLRGCTKHAFSARTWGRGGRAVVGGAQVREPRPGLRKPVGASSVPSPCARRALWRVPL